MPSINKVISDFVKQYNKEFDFYQELARIVATKLDDEVIKQGIKAIITHRAKRPDRLKEKLFKRNEVKNYKNNEEISDDILDLAGVRAALYFPSENSILSQIISDTFEVVEKKVFPNEAHTPKPGKRFSGYWATHYRVKIKAGEDNKRYKDTIVEIQVASVLMHAWSEVEHDLVYKPLSGNLSEDELAILDQINGLVLAGEIALERLQKAMAERTRKQDNISDKYELTNLIVNSLGKEYFETTKLGPTFLLNNFNKNIEKISSAVLNDYLTKVDPDSTETVTDQILDMLLSDNYDLDFKQYFESLKTSKKSTFGFESFVKCWIVLEKAVREIELEQGIQTSKYLVPRFVILKDQKLLSSDELEELNNYRSIRNRLVHGLGQINEENLQESFFSLSKITAKVIKGISIKTMKTQLNRELAKLAMSFKKG
jgi:ppGpp synthetase/RelA/SpoT-type nucleotidyltranferase